MPTSSNGSSHGLFLRGKAVLYALQCARRKGQSVSFNVAHAQRSNFHYADGVSVYSPTREVSVAVRHCDSWKQFCSCDWLVYWILKSDGNFSKCFLEGALQIGMLFFALERRTDILFLQKERHDSAGGTRWCRKDHHSLESHWR